MRSRCTCILATPNCSAQALRPKATTVPSGRTIMYAWMQVAGQSAVQLVLQGTASHANGEPHPEFMILAPIDKLASIV